MRLLDRCRKTSAAVSVPLIKSRKNGKWVEYWAVGKLGKLCTGSYG
jgi:hypothetical protein